MDVLGEVSHISHAGARLPPALALLQRRERRVVGDHVGAEPRRAEALEEAQGRHPLRALEPRMRRKGSPPRGGFAEM